MVDVTPAGERLYRVTVEGGNTFTYDTIDVGRFAIRMAELRDWRPFTVEPLCGSCLGSGHEPSEAVPCDECHGERVHRWNT